MGWGDEVMITGIAKRRQATDPRPCAVRDRSFYPRWHEIWQNNPRILQPSEIRKHPRVQWIDNFPGNRPYLDYDKFRNRDKSTPYVYTDFRVTPGEIYLSDEERRLSELARGAVILEPNVKPNASPNKSWGWDRWARLAWILRDLELVQLGAPGSPVLAGVRYIPTRTVREACGILAGAALLIAPEGGLHHAAAALEVGAVVLFGGFISPETTGYASHTNFFTGGRACGMRVACAHCAEAMAKITPAAVAEAARARLTWRSEHARLSATR